MNEWSIAGAWFCIGIALLLAFLNKREGRKNREYEKVEKDRINIIQDTIDQQENRLKLCESVLTRWLKTEIKDIDGKS